MEINGLIKLTLLDYPQKTAATVFLGGCNFRCPFCQNSDLVIPGRDRELISEEDFFAFLRKRKGLLDGVCITGGEPTIRPDLSEFIKKIRAEGFLVKLDTNGTNPKMLKEMLEENILDYIAMDIKSPEDGYQKAAGIPDILTDNFVKKIKESISLIMNSGIEYEFRTTAVKELHTAEDFAAIGEMIQGAPKYYIQNFEDSGHILRDGYHGFTRKELEEFAAEVKPYVRNVEIRGIDE